jgi:hypothetical protein
MRRLVFSLLVSLLMAAPTAANVVYNFNGTYFLFDSTTNNFTTAFSQFSLTTSVPLHATGTTGGIPDQAFVPGPDLTCNGCDHVGF